MEAAIQTIWVVMGLIFGFVIRYVAFAAFPGRMASATKWAVVAVTALPMVVVMTFISTGARTMFLIGAGAGALVGWVMALAGRRRRDEMLNRTPLSDEVADHHYVRILRLRQPPSKSTGHGTGSLRSPSCRPVC